MNAIPLLRQLRASGVEITTDGCEVRWRDASGILDAETLDVLRAEKAAVIAFLEAEAYRADRFEELAAILEFDDHMPRAEAERAAFRIVHGDET